MTTSVGFVWHVEPCRVGMEQPNAKAVAQPLRESFCSWKPVPVSACTRVRRTQCCLVCRSRLLALALFVISLLVFGSYSCRLRSGALARRPRRWPRQRRRWRASAWPLRKLLGCNSGLRRAGDGQTAVTTAARLPRRRGRRGRGLRTRRRQRQEHASWRQALQHYQHCSNTLFRSHSQKGTTDARQRVGLPLQVLDW